MSEPAPRVAIYGGSFNPPHVAHVLAAAYALACAPVDEILVVPVFHHPFAKALAPYEDRLELCRLAFGFLPRLTISSIERDLGGDSLTLRTLEELQRLHPTWAMRLMVGADVLGDLPKWHRWDRVAELAPPLVLGRRGFAGDGGGLKAGTDLLPNVSSTTIRAACAAGNLAEVRELLPRAVADYIAQRDLYR